MTTPCPHCQNPAPADSAHAPYCCHGCLLAHRFITEAGLGRYYDLRQGPGAPARDRDAGEHEIPAFVDALLSDARAAKPVNGDDGALRVSVDVAGIQCAACVFLLEQLFKRRAGALRITVNPGLGRLELWFREPAFSLAGYLDDIAGLGYKSGPARKEADAPLDDLVVRFGVVAAIAMNSMIFSFSVYFGLSRENDRTLFSIFQWLNLALTLASVVVGGGVFFRGAVKAQRPG